MTTPPNSTHGPAAPAVGQCACLARSWHACRIASQAAAVLLITRHHRRFVPRALAQRSTDRSGQSSAFHCECLGTIDNVARSGTRLVADADIDHFKDQATPMAIRRATACCKRSPMPIRCVRPMDTVALTVARDCRRAAQLPQLVWHHMPNVFAPPFGALSITVCALTLTLKVTVSVRAPLRPVGALHRLTWTERADIQLYKAKPGTQPRLPGSAAKEIYVGTEKNRPVWTPGLG